MRRGRFLAASWQGGKNSKVYRILILFGKFCPEILGSKNVNLMRVTFTVCYPIPIHRIELSTGRDHDGLLCVVNCRYLRYSSNNSLFFDSLFPLLFKLKYLTWKLCKL